MNSLDGKIAIVHDLLQTYGGAESVLKVLADLYPSAPVFTMLYNKQRTDQWLKDRQIKTSFLQKAPLFLRKRYKWLLPMMPAAPETFNLRDYQLVISSCSGFSKGVIVKPGTTHICYMHAPMRYVWDWSSEYLSEQRLGKKRKILVRLLLNYLRMWDRAAIERVDYLAANSEFTARRIWKYYKKKATVIYPPVNVNAFVPTKEHGDYFLTVSRITSSKRIRLIIETFCKLKLPLVVAGDGPEQKFLKKKFGNRENIRFVGWVEEAKKVELMQNARAFVFAAEDDFGITPVEAMAAGKPVIALRAGGIVETMIEGVTGEFFEVPQIEMLADGVRRFIEKEADYDAMEIRRQAEKFSVNVFKQKFQEYVAAATK